MEKYSIANRQSKLIDKHGHQIDKLQIIMDYFFILRRERRKKERWISGAKSNHRPHTHTDFSMRVASNNQAIVYY